MMFPCFFEYLIIFFAGSWAFEKKKKMWSSTNYGLYEIFYVLICRTKSLGPDFVQGKSLPGWTSGTFQNFSGPQYPNFLPISVCKTTAWMCVGTHLFPAVCKLCHGFCQCSVSAWKEITPQSSLGTRWNTRYIVKCFVSILKEDHQYWEFETELLCYAT